MSAVSSTSFAAICGSLARFAAIAAVVSIGWYTANAFFPRPASPGSGHPSQLAVLPDSIDLGQLGPSDRGVFVVQLMNFGTKPSKVIAAHGSCGCLSTANVPVTVPPGELKPLRVTVEPASKAAAGDQRYTINLLTDQSYAPLQLVVTLNRRGS